jgi:PKD repeat protein
MGLLFETVGWMVPKSVGAGTAGPTASFDIDVSTGDAPLTVTVTDTSTGDPTAWEWDWGDGSSVSNNQNDSHEYTESGLYLITLTASNAGGSSEATTLVFVTGAGQWDFSNVVQSGHLLTY